MSTAIEAKPLFSKDIVVADHFRLQLVRTVAEDGEEEIIGTVPAIWDFGDWRRDEPDAGPGGALHPHPAAILKDCSREIGFGLVYRELDDGVDYADDGTITLTFERAPEAPAAGGATPSGQGQPEPAAPEAAAPAVPEPPRLQGLSEVELLRRQLAETIRVIGEFKLDALRRRKRAQQIEHLRTQWEADKKAAASSKAALDEACLSWVSQESQEEPLWDYTARGGNTAPPTINGHVNGAPKPLQQDIPKNTPPTVDNAWKKEPLSVLGLSETILKKLDANDPPLRTVGDLQQMVERLGKEGFTDPIAQIKGIGAKTAEKIDVAFQEFWSKRPAVEAKDEPPAGAPKVESAADLRAAVEHVEANGSKVPEGPGEPERGQAEAHKRLALYEPEKLAGALRAALHGFAGAEARWAKLKENGATDAQLKAAIATEFGNGGGGSNPVSYYHEGGKQPKFWLGDSREGKPTLAGKALVAKVREVMGVPEGGEEAE